MCPFPACSEFSKFTIFIFGATQNGTANSKSFKLRFSSVLIKVNILDLNNPLICRLSLTSLSSTPSADNDDDEEDGETSYTGIRLYPLNNFEVYLTHPIHCLHLTLCAVCCGRRWDIMVGTLWWFLIVDNNALF